MSKFILAICLVFHAQKCICSWGSTHTLLGKLTVLPDPVAGGEGLAAPPQKPHPTLSLDYQPCPPTATSGYAYYARICYHV